MVQCLDLKIIASRLEGLEETIISKLIDRAQFSANQKIYERGQSGFDGESHKSLFDLRLAYQEQMDALFGRFCVPEERPFNKDLPQARRNVNLPDTGLKINDYDKINLTSETLQCYMHLVRQLCISGDDGQYGSSVEHDVYAVQAIARRIHFGALYVAESKFRSSPKTYLELIEKGDREAILDLLTRKDVEKRIIDRISEKTIAIQATADRQIRFVIDPQTVVAFYRDSIIPLTKKGEILYLMNRREN